MDNERILDEVITMLSRARWLVDKLDSDSEEDDTLRKYIEDSYNHALEMMLGKKMRDADNKGADVEVEKE
jgi:hypothetical protein